MGEKNLPGGLGLVPYLGDELLSGVLPKLLIGCLVGRVVECRDVFFFHDDLNAFVISNYSRWVVL